MISNSWTRRTATCVQVDMGLNPYLIDKAIAGSFGMPMGPFRWARCDVWNSNAYNQSRSCSVTASVTLIVDEM